MTVATGVGSWPGSDIGSALRAVRDLLGELDPDTDGVAGLPYLPELPDRGPGAELVGRAAGLLVDLHVDLQPAGWRLVERRGRDASRTTALWRQDLDELAEAYDGYAGRLKLTVAGPWTLAASVWLTRGERAIVDPSACRDLAASLAEGVRDLLGRVQRLVPLAELVLQVDEPSLPAVLEGRLPTASGLGRLRVVEDQEALGAMVTVLAAAGERHTVVHCCADHPPLPLLRRTGAGGLSLDTVALTPRGWEGLAVAVEDGAAAYAGCVPATGSVPRVAAVADRVAEAWSRLGMPLGGLAALGVSPTCGLAGLAPEAAAARQHRVVEVARELAHRAAGDWAGGDRPGGRRDDQRRAE